MKDIFNSHHGYLPALVQPCADSLSTHMYLLLQIDMAFYLQSAFKEFSYSTFRYAPSTNSVLIKYKLVDGGLNLPIQIKCTESL